MLIEQFPVSLWCGANRFSQLEINRHDRVLARVFGWTKLCWTPRRGQAF